LAKKNKEVPCFYVLWQDRFGKKRVAFGHTGMFRLAYRKTIGEHIFLPEYSFNSQALENLKKLLNEQQLKKISSLKNRKFSRNELNNLLEEFDFKKKTIETILQAARLIDMAEAIFGNETSFAGRVFFEDAPLQGNSNDLKMGERTPKILSGPKPTTFQHYLVQGRDDIHSLNHYNTNASIRGHKLYWHKSGNNWEETRQQEITKHGTQYTTINPMKPGAKFVGRIRFENLSNIELGALLLTLDLPEGCCHKLGMGKPLGLGSIRISPKLFLSERKERYSSLMAEWELPESQKVAEMKSSFKKFIGQTIMGDENQSFWEIPRMKELKTILELELGTRLEQKNEYMTITQGNEFKNRPILPLPSKVL